MRFEALLLIFASASGLCFCRYAYKQLWDLGKKARVYCVVVFLFTILFLIVGWYLGLNQGIFNKV